MNTQLLINAIVQQTMVFVARLATAGGVRAPLANVADQVFRELTAELQRQGVSKRVIADMFGMALRTYHRRVGELEQSGTLPGRTVWEAVLEFVRAHDPSAARAIYERFSRDDADVVAGVLNDLVDSGLVYRSGRGDTAVYKPASAADFADSDERRQLALQHVVWLVVYRSGPITVDAICSALGVSPDQCERAVSLLSEAGRIKREPDGYVSERFEVPVGQSHGWEAAVLDHYQALVNAVAAKLDTGAQAAHQREHIGGATYSFDLPAGHPLEQRVLSQLSEVRERMVELRKQVDDINRTTFASSELDEPRRVVFYVGQYVKS
jgi:hypothetical protein